MINNKKIFFSDSNPFKNDRVESIEYSNKKNSKTVDEIKDFIEGMSSQIGLNFSFGRIKTTELTGTEMNNNEQKIQNYNELKDDSYSIFFEDKDMVKEFEGCEKQSLIPDDNEKKEELIFEYKNPNTEKKSVETELFKKTPLALEIEELEKQLLIPDEIKGQELIIENEEVENQEIDEIIDEPKPLKQDEKIEPKSSKWKKRAFIAAGIGIALGVLGIGYYMSSDISDMETNTCPAIVYENSTEDNKNINFLTDLSKNVFSEITDVACNISSELTEIVSNKSYEIVNYVNSTIFEKKTSNFSTNVWQENAIHFNNTFAPVDEENDKMQEYMVESLESILPVAKTNFGILNYLKETFTNRFVSDLTLANSISL